MVYATNGLGGFYQYANDSTSLPAGITEISLADYQAAQAAVAGDKADLAAEFAAVVDAMKETRVASRSELIAIGISPATANIMVGLPANFVSDDDGDDDGDDDKRRRRRRRAPY